MNALQVFESISMILDGVGSELYRSSCIFENESFSKKIPQGVNTCTTSSTVAVCVLVGT